MDELHRHLFTVLMDREWKHGVAVAVDITLLGRFYERFADHTVEVGRRVVFQVTGRPIYIRVSQVASQGGKEADACAVSPETRTDRSLLSNNETRSSELSRRGRIRSTVTAAQTSMTSDRSTARSMI
jgi:hypothetical protein